MLKIKKLNFSFGNHLILDSLDLTCEEGKTIGVLGLNGAGKTTFFRTLYGFYQAQNGTITWNEKPLDRKNIAFLETDNYFYPFTKGLEYLQLMTEMKVEETKILAWNELFELPLDEIIDTYSTGMKKKLAFLGCLLQNRPILLLDEPFNGIDLESSERMFIILQKLRDSGKTIILSSHILTSLTSVCDTIVHLQKGKIEKSYQRNDFDTFSLAIRQEVNDKIETQLAGLKF